MFAQRGGCDLDAFRPEGLCLGSGARWIGSVGCVSDEDKLFELELQKATNHPSCRHIGPSVSPGNEK